MRSFEFGGRSIEFGGRSLLLKIERMAFQGGNSEVFLKRSFIAMTRRGMQSKRDVFYRFESPWLDLALPMGIQSISVTMNSVVA